MAVPANAKMRELNEKFLAALEREREKAADAQTAAVLKDEIERMTAEQSVPDTDPPELPESLQRLRAIYREQRDKAADREPARSFLTSSHLDNPRAHAGTAEVCAIR